MLRHPLLINIVKVRLRSFAISLIGLLSFSLSLYADILGPYLETSSVTCPDGMSRIVVHSSDWKYVTIRLRALDGSNKEYTLQSRYAENQPPYIYFLTNGDYCVVDITDGYNANSNFGVLSVGSTFTFNGGYITFTPQLN